MRILAAWALLPLLLTLLTLCARSDEDRGPPIAVRMAVVPAGPVSDQTRVEVRLGLENRTNATHDVAVQVFIDRIDPAARVHNQTLTLAAGDRTLVRRWWGTETHAGRHRVLYQIDAAGQCLSGEWPLDVLASDASGLPVFQGVWLEPVGVLWSCETDRPEETAANVRASIDAVCRLDMNMIVLGAVEYLGMFFYPSEIEFFDREVNRQCRGRDCRFDMVEMVLSQADRHDKHVFLGLGRGGDLQLLWEFDRPDWPERNRAAIALAQRIARELWDRYGHHRSFYGWYLTHEMSDLARASAYYNPVADFCHHLAPEKPVLVAPADVPDLPTEVLKNSSVDIFAYQDAVGAGYVPGKYTYQPENRLKMLDEVFSRYRQFHEGTDKHCWADLEIWEMDGSQGYGGAYPASFARVQRQIDVERKHVPVLTAYAWHGYMHDPACRGNKIDPRAVQLFEAYAAWKKTVLTQRR